MLKIWLGPFRKNCIINPSGYFDDHKKPEWFNDPWVKEVIKKIDHVDAIKDEYMVSPILGAMTPMHLSSGCKSLILLRQNPMCNVYATRCGDNCAKYIYIRSRRRPGCNDNLTSHDVISKRFQWCGFRYRRRIS